MMRTIMVDPEAPSDLEGFQWFNEPIEYSFVGGGLSMRTGRRTDFWQRTHYGFRKDDGHAFLKTISGDFSILTRALFKPEAQYDQCGLFARIDSDNWIKCSTEFENSHLSRLGSVVTNLGFSDWASQDINSPTTSMWYKLSRSGRDFLLEHSPDGKLWHQMRVAHLHRLEGTIDVGIYACSPVGDGFMCSFEFIEIGASKWGDKE